VKYKVVVLGAGPGGYAAAIRAAQLGVKVALVERDKIGGTCMNRGCIPAKVLVSAASLVRSIHRAAGYGIILGTPGIDPARMVEKKNQVVSRLARGMEFMIKKNKIDYFGGNARIAGNKRVIVESGKGSLELEAENIILATGTSAPSTKSFGCDGDRVITSDGALNLQEVPERLLIIGGGSIGCEFACIFSALGSKVTILEIMPAILPSMDREAARQLQGLMVKQGIKIKTKYKTDRIVKKNNAVAAVSEGLEEIAADKILICTGRVINSRDIGLEQCGVALGDYGQIVVNDKMETLVKGIYAVGDITGRANLAYVASAQGIVAAENIMGGSRQMDYGLVPFTVFTHPEAAGVGITSQEAERTGISINSAKFSFIASGRAQTMSEAEGFVKIFADTESDRILGVHIVGPHAADLISEAVVAMRMGTTVKQLADTIHPHPTLSESVMEAAGLFMS